MALDSPDDPGQVEVHVRVDGKRSGLDFTAHEEYAGERVVAIATYGMIENELRVRPHASDRPTTED